MLVMAVDPGSVHIGVAMNISGTYATCTLTSKDELWKTIAEHRPEVIVCEEFYRSNRIDGNMIKTMNVVGGVEAVCVALNIKYVGQTNQVRISFIPDAEAILISQRGYINRSKNADDHEIQALAHLLCYEYAVKHGPVRKRP